MTYTDIAAPFEPGIDAESEAQNRRVRLAQQAAMLRRRSRFIKTLRLVFPGAIIGLILLNLGWIAVTSILSSLNVYASATNEIRMTNPRYFGQGANGGHYTISGLEAIRKGKDSKTVALKAPNMDFKGQGEGSSHISSATGVFNIDTKKFTLNGHVVLMSGGADFTLKTEQAVVDMSNSTFYGDKHVEGDSSLGHIVGESFVVSNDGQTIVFKGKGDTKVWATVNQ